MMDQKGLRAMFLFSKKLQSYVVQRYWYALVAIVVIGYYLGTGSNYTYGVIFSLACYIGLIQFVAKSFEAEAVRMYAQKIGWTYFDRDIEGAQMPTAGIIFHTGENQKIYNIARGEVSGTTGTVCSLEYTIKITEKQSQTFYWTVLQLDLGAPSPHIVLDSRQDFFSGQSSTINDCEKIELEGNFQKYFKVFIQKGSSVESLTILSPDVMGKLIDYDKSYSIEIIGSTAIFILEGIVQDTMELEALFRNALAFYTTTSPKLMRMKTFG